MLQALQVSSGSACCGRELSSRQRWRHQSTPLTNEGLHIVAATPLGTRWGVSPSCFSRCSRGVSPRCHALFVLCCTLETFLSDVAVTRLRDVAPAWRSERRQTADRARVDTHFADAERVTQATDRNSGQIGRGSASRRFRPARRGERGHATTESCSTADAPRGRFTAQGAGSKTPGAKSQPSPTTTVTNFWLSCGSVKL
jgi:hypothetical protein